MYRYILTLLLFYSVGLKAQDLFKTRDVALAYKNNTRALDGRPGKNYWQNRGKYDINLSLNPDTRIVSGSETIKYFNNSPDTLKTLVFKLILNNHRATAAKWGNVSKDYITEGINITSFIINGQSGLWKKGMGETTTQSVTLQEPLVSGGIVEIKIEWNYTLAKQYGREGTIDPNSFYIAYFYPRLAVYDDYNGWDMVDHTNGPEFYSDFNDYKLSISVPANYIVWATGDLVNMDEVLQKDAALRLKESLSTNKVINIATKDQLANKAITKQKTNTWKFEANNIADVALGVSNHFLWDGTSTIVDDNTGRKASMQAAYADSTTSFRTMVAEGAQALNWYSHNYPGVPYPFTKMTAFQGNANMETPGMINDSSLPGIDNRRVANHEIAHSWFPFYMGTNETRYAFMDEAWASFLELLIAPSFMDSTEADNIYKSGRVAKWASSPAATTDIPIITPSFELKDAYRVNAYGKPSMAYMALKDMLGDKLFKKCLLEYMNRWHGKHPIPWDFFYTFNDASGKNLNWFWNNWFFTPYHMDIAVKDVNKINDAYKVIINNVGGFAIPFTMHVIYEDGKEIKLHQKASVWENNERQAIISIPLKGHIKKVLLDTDMYIDYNPADNIKEL